MEAIQGGELTNQNGDFTKKKRGLMEDEMITSAQVDQIVFLITRKGDVTNKNGDIMKISW